MKYLKSLSAIIETLNNKKNNRLMYKYRYTFYSLTDRPTDQKSRLHIKCSLVGIGNLNKKKLYTYYTCPK